MLLLSTWLCAFLMPTCQSKTRAPCVFNSINFPLSWTTETVSKKWNHDGDAPHQSDMLEVVSHEPRFLFMSGCATRLAKSKQPLSHSATLPERLDQPLSHSGRAADAATQPLSHSEWLSGWVAGPATLTRAAEWLSGCGRLAGAATEPLSHWATQPLSHSGRAANVAT